MTNSTPQTFAFALAAEDLVIDGECPSSLDELRASLAAEHQPATSTESLLVNEIAEQFWRVSRMRACEARGMQVDAIDGSLSSGVLAFVERTMAAAERGLHRAITTLRRLQADRGFVPSKMRPTASQAADPVDPIAEPKPSTAPLARPNGSSPSFEPYDFDVENILSDYPEHEHESVLQSLAEFRAAIARRDQLTSMR